MKYFAFHDDDDDMSNGDSLMEERERARETPTRCQMLGFCMVDLLLKSYHHHRRRCRRCRHPFLYRIARSSGRI